MTQEIMNPSDNRLSIGVTPEMVIDAALKSGFPLQTLVRTEVENTLRERLHAGTLAQEEWGFLDPESQTHRTLDIYVSVTLSSWQERLAEHLSFGPVLDLFIECKRSELPYVFFQSKTKRSFYGFPEVAGIDHPQVQVSVQGTEEAIPIPLLVMLGLAQGSFSNAPYSAFSFSRASRKSGGELELTGSDAYQSIIFPVLKAVDYDRDNYEKLRPAIHLVVPLCVMDAPMFIVDTDGDVTQGTMCPWIRVFRHNETGIVGLRGVDFVHRAYLQTYLTEWLVPFTQKFDLQVRKHQEMIVLGRAVLSSNTDLVGELESLIVFPTPD